MTSLNDTTDLLIVESASSGGGKWGFPAMLRLVEFPKGMEYTTIRNRNAKQHDAVYVDSRNKGPRSHFGQVKQNFINRMAKHGMVTVYGKSDIARAAVRGDVAKILLLIGQGADVNERGLNGNTPLHEATCRGHVEAVRALLSHGADPTIENHFACNPMQCARGPREDEIRAMGEERKRVERERVELHALVDAVEVESRIHRRL